MRTTSFLTGLVVALASAQVLLAQANLPVYTDNLVNGFQNRSWATVNTENTSPTYGGSSHSISVIDKTNYQALYLKHSDFNTSPYASLSFWINGGAGGGQKLRVCGLLNGKPQTPYSLGTLPSDTWKQFTIPLSVLHVADEPDFSGVRIQGSVGTTQPTFYVDDIQLVAAPAPAMVHLGVNAASVLGRVDARQFGVNTATWDSNLDTPQTIALLRQAGVLTLRFPGGSTSDHYNWAQNKVGNRAMPTSYTQFANVATNLDAQVFITVNYGSGTPGEAAAWVRSANLTNHYDFKYWEIGNECYGSWEHDTHAIPHDPYTYATNAVAYIQQMKAADPAAPIKVGVVVVPGENSYSNNATHFAVNPVTGATNYGWTPIVLSTMKRLGVLPDFLIYHFYPQYTPTNWAPNSTDSDPLLLQVADNPSPATWSDWASAAANLRQQINDYLGPAGSNIELCVTENNCDAGRMGRQSTSLVNALYLADSTCSLMKTEFKSYIWWDLYNGADTRGDFDPTLYGWRTNGDYGILSTANSPYPTFYAEKLLRYFARPGDLVLNATSDYLLLSAYAVHRTNGALTLLVLNKDTTASFNAEITLTNFVPRTNATIRSYGIPQDQAAEFNESASLQGIATRNYRVAGTNFTYTFPPLSLTLFTFAPEPSTHSVHRTQSNRTVSQVQGQLGTPHRPQSSLDFINRTPTSTNTLVGKG